MTNDDYNQHVKDSEQYRQLLITLHERIKKIYINKVGLDYGIIKINECDGKFYFEKELLNEN